MMEEKKDIFNEEYNNEDANIKTEHSEDIVISKEEYERLKALEEKERIDSHVNRGNLYAKSKVSVNVLNWVIIGGCLACVIAIIYGVLTR